jgi:hypothetical protein
MKAQTLISTNALLALGLGIAFALYGPLALALFGTPDVQGAAGTPEVETLLYWTVASFARLFGAALFAFGLLLWAARPLFLGDLASPSTRRGFFFALLLGNAMLAFVAGTQQFSVWNSAAGWVVLVLFSLLALGYGILVARTEA